ncbi:unnamed protein product [Ambrosiozyma monospora]|uniref:Large ribosomal subunit protein mL60 n=1 Tax=Ambrosiozyma monospora TaxID=43982 RepID=A0A9W6YXC1_AMBMO|nr:unnamed protein product [Ambrosiozyma monospora]
MFGPFRSSQTCLGGLLWKRPWRLSQPQKYRQRKRMQQVDSNIQALYDGLTANKMKAERITNLMENFPKESEMLPKDKYTVFDKHSRGYRKAAHFVPKWTKLSFRDGPKNF